MSYDVAQVCLNGHVANPSFRDYPEFNQDYCEKCGARTITSCPQCEKPIRGSYREGISLGYEPPAFCIYCGAPFPWTQSKVQAAQELARQINGLSEDERELLAESIESLVKDTPSTLVAANRFKSFLSSTGKSLAPAFKDILIDVVTEAVRKMIWG